MEPLDQARTLLPGEQDLDPDRTILALDSASPRELSDEEPIPSQRLGRFIVLGTLGRGGMGTVLRAYDETLDRTVALKLLHTDVAKAHRARLLREAQALARLSHPNVVQIHDVGEVDDRMFITMELVEGRPLDQWQEQHRSWRSCLEVYLQAGRGLAAAHDHGLVHRDFKPANCILGAGGRVRVLDFGLARELDEPPGREPSEREPSGREPPDREPTDRQPTTDQPTTDQPIDEAPVPSSQGSGLGESLTQTGAVLGTLAYMPPEQLCGATVDAKSDQFSFCVALFEAIHGERPFRARTMAELVGLMMDDPRPVPGKARVPTRLQRALLRGLAKDPEQRWPSMDALLTELQRVARPKWRGWVGLTAVGVGLVAVGAGLWREATAGRVCEGARRHLDGVWDDARRQQLESAILGTTVTYSPDTWARVQQGLDAYADQWTKAHADACEATSVRREQSTETLDLRMACLTQRRVALREAVGVLATADDTVVREAVQLVSKLPGLSRCADVAALQQGLTGPEDAEVVAEVERLRGRLARAQALQHVGKYAEASAEAEAVSTEAEGLGYAPLVVEATLRRGMVESRDGRYEAAGHDLEQAYALGLEHGHTQAATSAAIRLIHLRGFQQAKHEVGLTWGLSAVALAKQPRAEPLDLAAALGSIGAVLLDKGELERASEHCQRALELIEQAPDARPMELVPALTGVANVLRVKGELGAAVEHYRRILALTEEALGPHHPSVASALYNLGAVEDGMGQHDEALAHQRRALSIREATLDPLHPAIARSLHAIAVMLARRGEHELAAEHLRRALSITEQSLGPDHPDVAYALGVLGTVLRDQERFEDARVHLERAVALRERVLGPEHPLLAESLIDLGSLHSEMKEPALALEHHQRALAILEKAHGETHPHVVAALINVGQSLHALGKLEPAAQQLRRAIELAERLGDPARELRTGAESALERVERTLDDAGSGAPQR